jgi:hypothetical protein
MSLNRNIRLLLYVLPFVLARLLLPAGFMPTLQDGELRLAFCGVVATAPADGDTAAADPHPLDGNDHCPFAQPTLAMLPVLPAEPPAVPMVLPPPATPVYFQPTTGPPRAFGSRAPPVQFSV